MAENMIWTEGPVYSNKHQTLYFSDVPAGKIYALKDKKVSLLKSNSGEINNYKTNDNEPLFERGSNGLALSESEDELYIC